MRKLSLVCVPLLGLVLLPGLAKADEFYWHDPERGCGLLDNWKKTYRIADLPGCDGELKKNAPPGETAMHDAKKLLREAEKAIDSGQPGDYENKIAQATEIMNKAPQDPRTIWARGHFAKAIAVLRSRAALAPKLSKIRDNVKAVSDLTAQAKPDGKALGDAVASCVASIKEAEQAGVDMAVPVELSPGQSKPLRAFLSECEAATAKAAATEPATKPPEATPTTKPETPTATAAGTDGGVPREKWVKKLKGDRKKTFEAHPDAFPAFDGEPGPKAAAKAAEWRYGAEVIRFKGNKLLKTK